MPWLQPVTGKLSLTAFTCFLLRHLQQVFWGSDVSSSPRMNLCYKLQIALQVMSNGGLRCSLNKGSCLRSSDAMTLWRSQIDAHCVCKQGPHMMSRPGPKSGTGSSKRNRSLDAFSSWCESWVPSRRAPKKPPTRYAVNFAGAESLRRNSYKAARPASNSVGQYTLGASNRGHTFSCAPHSGHMTFPFLQTCSSALQTGFPN